eukprot:scaffold172474_cov31-Tisochrysis_lutea.AAC.3
MIITNSDDQGIPSGIDCGAEAMSGSVSHPGSHTSSNPSLQVYHVRIPPLPPCRKDNLVQRSLGGRED